MAHLRQVLSDLVRKTALEMRASDRPYGPGVGVEEALAEIERGRGIAYDPDVAEICLRLFREKSYALPG